MPGFELVGEKSDYSIFLGGMTKPMGILGFCGDGLYLSKDHCVGLLLIYLRKVSRDRSLRIICS